MFALNKKCPLRLQNELWKHLLLLVGRSVFGYEFLIIDFLITFKMLGISNVIVLTLF